MTIFIVWAAIVAVVLFVVCRILDGRIAEIKRNFIQLVSEINGNLNNIENAYRALDEKINEARKFAQSKADSAINKVDKLKASIGDLDTDWDEVVEHKTDDVFSDHGAVAPNLVERLNAMEKFLGVEFVHRIDESRGYEQNPSEVVFKGVPCDPESVGNKETKSKRK